MPSVRVAFRSIALVVLSTVIAACGPRQADTRHFEMRGQILALRGDNEVLVKHDDIRGFMPAMTMPYKVRDVELVRDKSAGDLVSATIAVSDTDAWLTRLDKIGAAPLPEEATRGSNESPVAPVEPGVSAADATLTDANGRELSVAQWKGSAVALTFVYTRCPLPQYCPLMDRRFSDVQRAVKGDPTLSGRVHLLSVSFDPDHDTPAVLRAHAGRLGADDGVWHFATAPRETVDRFAGAFGVNVIREADQTITHNLRTAVIDPSGRVATLYDGTDWTPGQIVADLRRALASR